MQDNDRNVPDWLLERLALGELDAETAADVRRRLAAAGRSPEDITQAVATSNRELLAELPAAQAAAEIRRRAARTAAAEPRPARRRLALWSLPAVVAGGLALALMTWRSTPDEGVASRVGENPEIIIAKRNPEPRLYVYRHVGDGNQRLKDGARAARGDLLQVAYGGEGYGVVLSIDGAGKVTLHWPDRDASDAPAVKDGENRIPAAYELDDAPAFERFFLVQAKAPFPVATVMNAARALAAQPSARRQALELPPRFEQISIALDKTPAAKKEQP